MEGVRFRKLPQNEMDAIIPRLQVLARSSPTDKQILVQRLKAIGETVAVTGGNCIFKKKIKAFLNNFFALIIL